MLWGYCGGEFEMRECIRGYILKYNNLIFRYLCSAKVTRTLTGHRIKERDYIIQTMSEIQNYRLTAKLKFITES